MTSAVHKRFVTASPAIIVLAVLLGASGCGGSGGGSNGLSGQSITLYSGQFPETTDALVAGFEKATGITVRVRSNEEAPLANEIVMEGARSAADVIYTENSPALEYLQSKGLLAPVQPATLAKTPSAYNSPQGDWVGVSTRVSLLIYNTSRIRAGELPTTALQLASPRYRGKLALAPAEPDFLPVIVSMEKRYGRAATLNWLEGLKRNAGSHIYSDNEAVTSEVNRGVAALGIAEQFYWYRMRAQLGASGLHSKIAYLAPHDPGYVIGVSGAAVLASSKHPAAARRFLSFLVSRRGRRILARSTEFEYVFGEPASGSEVPFDQLAPSPIAIGEVGDGSSATALLRDAGLL